MPAPSSLLALFAAVVAADNEPGAAADDTLAAFLAIGREGGGDGIPRNSIEFGLPGP